MVILFTFFPGGGVSRLILSFFCYSFLFFIYLLCVIIHDLQFCGGREGWGDLVI